ncbi:MAG: NAD(P)(+) transhydrogenase (Re/Si-specific) subunit beta [Firmicutes bacterium]|nr:NAD(P)(+) transhydrogenase (Re/Si-specific) subunit beta [Bacillota bacterium]
MAEAVHLAYLAAAVLFIVGIMRLRQPATARSGNLVAAAGMLLALAVTATQISYGNMPFILPAVAVGAAVGAGAGRRVRMTAMPQMVALFNGMGGGAAGLVAFGEIWRGLAQGGALPLPALVTGLVTVLIGGVSLSGSLLAFAKLQEIMTGRPILFAGQSALNALLLAAGLAAGVDVAATSGHGALLVLLAAVALALGVGVVLPVGGADMPVIISLLNALTGLAASATGFVLANALLIVAGALVGASGTILTLLMARAMNRSLANVLFAGVGSVRAGGTGAAEGSVHPTNAEDVATLLAYAQRVVIVPGYGLAVARAQQEAKDLMVALEARGVDVKFGIHPVAGRMPGHMNVLLAEADVPYDRLYEMERINPEFERTDVALVVGANDVTNPAARTRPDSPIYGMPILDVDRARTVVVLKRSMAPGFAGIDNELYLRDNCRMLFGDAKASLAALLQALKEVDG